MALPVLPRASVLVSTSSALVLLDLAHPNTHSPITSFKPYSSEAPHHAVSLVPASSFTGLEGLVAWGEAGRKTLIHVASLGASAGSAAAGTATVRWIPPQQISVLSLSPDGSLLFSGCEDGRAYLWEVASGKLRCTWEPHFRRVSAVKWSPNNANSAFLTTGGEDGRVCVWNLVSLYHPSASPSSSSSMATQQYQQPQAYATFTAHLLPITSLQFSPEVGVGTGTGLKLWSASRDGTVKVWDIRSRTQLTNFTVDGNSAAGGEIRDIAVDPTCRFAFAAWAPVAANAVTLTGSADDGAGAASRAGRVYRIDLHRRVSSSSAGSTGATGWEAAGGQDELLGENPAASSTGETSVGAIFLPSPTMSPTCLSLAPSNSHLLVGTSNPPSVLVVDIRSSQVVRAIPFYDGSNSSVRATGRVTNIVSLYRPVPPVGETLAAAATRARGMVSRIVAPSLDRMNSPVEGLRGISRSGPYDVGSSGTGDEEEDEADEYWAILPDQTKSFASLTHGVTGSSSSFHPQWSDLERVCRSNATQQTTVGSTASEPGSGSAPQSDVMNHRCRIAELEERNRSLEIQLKRAAKINDEIWKAVVTSKNYRSTVGGGCGGDGASSGEGSVGKDRNKKSSSSPPSAGTQAAEAFGPREESVSRPAVDESKAKRKR